MHSINFRLFVKLNNIWTNRPLGLDLLGSKIGGESLKMLFRDWLKPTYAAPCCTRSMSRYIQIIMFKIFAKFAKKRWRDMSAKNFFVRFLNLTKTKFDRRFETNPSLMMEHFYKSHNFDKTLRLFCVFYSKLSNPNKIHFPINFEKEASEREKLKLIRNFKKKIFFRKICRNKVC